MKRLELHMQRSVREVINVCGRAKKMKNDSAGQKTPKTITEECEGKKIIKKHQATWKKCWLQI